MGWLLGALSAAGDAGVQSMNQNIEQQNRSDLEIQRSDLETQKAKAIALFNNQTKIDSDNQVRTGRADDIKEAAQEIANNRRDKAVTDQSQAAEDAYNKSDLSDADKQAGIIASRQYKADNTSDDDATPTSRDTIQAAVNKGYLPETTLYALDKQDAATAAQARLADIKERHEDNNVQRTIQSGEQNANWMKVQMAKIAADAADTKSGKNSAATALIQNVQMLKDMKYSDDDIKNFIFNKKEISLDDTVQRKLDTDPLRGTAKAMTEDQAVKSAIAVRTAIKAASSALITPSNSVTYNGKSSSYDSVPAGGLFTDPNGITRIKGGK